MAASSPVNRLWLLTSSRYRRQHGTVALHVVRLRTKLVNRHRGGARLPPSSLHGSGLRHGGLELVDDPTGAWSTSGGIELGIQVSRSIASCLVHSRHWNVSRTRVSDSCAVQHSVCACARHSPAESSFISDRRTRAHFRSVTPPPTTYSISTRTKSAIATPVDVGEKYLWPNG